MCNLYRVMFSNPVSAYRLFVFMTLLSAFPRRHQVDSRLAKTSCLTGYMNWFRCKPFISWFTTFIFSTCDAKCRTDDFRKGVCVTARIKCPFTGHRLMYVCDCTNNWKCSWNCLCVLTRENTTNFELEDCSDTFSHCSFSMRSALALYV